MQYSKYQKDFFRSVRRSNDNLLLSSTAGSGKTFSLVHASKLLRGSTIFIAFNKSIVKELERRVDPNISVSTIHGMGYKSLIRRFGNLQVRESKNVPFMINRFKQYKVDDDKYGGLIYSLSRLIDLHRLTLGYDLRVTADRYSIVITEDEMPMAEQILRDIEKYNSGRITHVDFVDMVVLPAVRPDVMLPSFDNILFDESQDASPAMIALLEKMEQDGSRIIAVGDRNQAIQGFAGGDTRSMDKLKEKFDMKELPLSICYRCGDGIIDLANRVWPNSMEPYDGTAEGTEYWGSIDTAESGDMIVCRNVKPLFDVYFTLLSMDKKVFIRGVDLAEGLARFLSPYKGKHMNTVFASMDKEIKKVSKELIKKGVKAPNKHPAIVKIQERKEIIKKLSNRYRTPARMIKGLKIIFSDKNQEGIMLSTIHKAKGLEAENVYFLDRHLIPNQFAKTQEELVQENNLKFVAVTRAKKALINCYSGGTEDDNKALRVMAADRGLPYFEN